MKIIYKQGDVTEAPEGVIAHGCNDLGVMGSGVAWAIRQKFPMAYRKYVFIHRDSGLTPGEIVYAKASEKLIANMITQRGVAKFHGHRVVDYEAIYVAFESLNTSFVDLGAVAMPRIGAGLGGGNWKIIASIIEETSTRYQPVVYDFTP